MPKIDFRQILSRDKQAQLTKEQQRAVAMRNRLAAYREESDPIRYEIEYDAQLAGTTPDLSPWFAKVAEIKERFPFEED